MYKNSCRFFAVVLLGLLQSCSVLPTPKAVVIEYFTLDTPALSVTQGSGNRPVLLVSRPQVRADLDTPRMAYREQDFTLRYYARSRWSEAPGQLILPSLIEVLDASGQFAAVLRAGSAATPQLRLDTEVLEFSQDYRGQSNRFQIRMRAQLIDLRTRRIIANRSFVSEQTSSEASPYAGAQAANAAWQKLLKELVSFSTQALATADSSPEAKH